MYRHYTLCDRILCYQLIYSMLADNLQFLLRDNGTPLFPWLVFSILSAYTRVCIFQHPELNYQTRVMHPMVQARETDFHSNHGKNYHYMSYYFSSIYLYVYSSSVYFDECFLWNSETGIKKYKPCNTQCFQQNIPK